MNIYIAYRDLSLHLSENTQMGRSPVNHDYRLVNVKDDIYLLIFGNEDYAVSKERAEQFIREVLSKCTGKHPGYFPLIPQLNGKRTAAVIELNNEYYDMDDDVLLEMLDDLRMGSGEPMDERSLINYCHPSAVLPDGDYDLISIDHRIYYRPVNYSPSAIQLFVPDKQASSFWIYEGNAFVQLYMDGVTTKFNVPSDMVSRIKAQVRELCKEPAEAYTENGDWEAYMTFGKARDKIFLDPGKTIDLLKEIASESIPSVSENKTPKAAAMSNASKELVCNICGTPHNGNKFCTNCGQKLR